VTSFQTPLLDALQWRYATKKFDPARGISEETWEILEQSLLLTPSSFGLQPWQFLVVENPETRAALRPVSWDQPQITEASHLVVFTARTDLGENDLNEWIACLSKAQSTPPDALQPLKSVIAGFIGPMSPEALHAWNVRQVYIALGQFMASAAVLGIDTCPLEGIDTSGYDQVLGLGSTGFATAVACAAGYRADNDKYATLPKARFSKSRLIRKI